MPAVPMLVLLLVAGRGRGRADSDWFGHGYQRRRATPLYLSNASGSTRAGGSSASPTPGWLGAGGLPCSIAEHVQQDWPR